MKEYQEYIKIQLVQSMFMMLTEWLDYNAGVTQGDTLSPYHVCHFQH